MDISHEITAALVDSTVAAQRERIAELEKACRIASGCVAKDMTAKEATDTLVRNLRSTPYGNIKVRLEFLHDAGSDGASEWLANLCIECVGVEAERLIGRLNR